MFILDPCQFIETYQFQFILCTIHSARDWDNFKGQRGEGCFRKINSMRHTTYSEAESNADQSQ